MGNVRIAAIPTEYKGIPFRSRLEAKYARALDLTGVKYQYEPEVFTLKDGSKYEPDFYLPERDVYLEIKGQASGYDVKRLRLFSEEKRLLVGFPDRIFALNFPGKITKTSWNEDEKFWDFDEIAGTLEKVAFRRTEDDWIVESGEEVYSGDSMQYLVYCPECGFVQFLDNCGGWACQKCGFYSGDYIIGHEVLDAGTVLRLVNELDIAPYMRQSTRACMNCKHATPNRHGWFGCEVRSGLQKTPERCGSFETAR